MIPIAYVFTILFLALGPLKPIPAFYKLTRQADRKYCTRVAVLATLISAAVIALVALFARELSRVGMCRLRHSRSPSAFCCYGQRSQHFHRWRRR